MHYARPINHVHNCNDDFDLINKHLFEYKVYTNVTKVDKKYTFAP